MDYIPTTIAVFLGGVLLIAQCFWRLLDCCTAYWYVCKNHDLSQVPLFKVGLASITFR